MKRNWNAWVWAGFGLTLVAAFSYISLFIWFPITRDIPWVTLLLFIAAGWLLAVGLKRAYGQPERYRGKVSRVVLGLLSLAVIGRVWYYTFRPGKDLPRPAGAPRSAPAGTCAGRRVCTRVCSAGRPDAFPP